MFTSFKAAMLLGCFFVLSRSLAHTPLVLPTLSIKGIICPNICRGETTYKVVFSASGGTVAASSGTVSNDTIVGVLAANYQITITVSGLGNEVLQKTVDLPICDPILPVAPIGANQLACEDGALPSLTVFSLNNNTVIDWFDQPVGGRKIASDTPLFQPTSAGVFYAETRFKDLGCVSISRTAIQLSVTRSICPVFTAQKVGLTP